MQCTLPFIQYQLTTCAPRKFNNIRFSFHSIWNCSFSHRLTTREPRGTAYTNVHTTYTAGAFLGHCDASSVCPSSCITTVPTSHTKQTGDERSMTIDRAGREAEDLTVYFIILLVAVWYAEGRYTNYYARAIGYPSGQGGARLRLLL